MAPRFEYTQAEEIRDAFARHGVRYLFNGKSGAILLGYPDTTQDADLFVDRTPENGRAAAVALRELGFALTADQSAEIERGKDFIQLKNGPFGENLTKAGEQWPVVEEGEEVRLVEDGDGSELVRDAPANPVKPERPRFESFTSPPGRPAAWP